MYYLQEDKKLGIDVLTESASLYEQTFGPIHPETAKSYSQLAMMHYQTDNLLSALTYQKQALICYERTRGIDDPETISQYVLFLHCYLFSRSLLGISNL